MEPTLVAEPVKKPAALGKTVHTRRNFLRLAACSAAGLAVYSGEIARHEIEVVHQTIKLAGLPEAFGGFRIVQISDVHFREYTEAAFLREVVSKANALEPDLVVLTGDFVSWGPLPRRFAVKMGYQCAELLSRLTCELRYAIMGNHDALVGARAVTDALVVHGIPVLANRFVPIERDGQRFWLAGIEDALEQRPDLTAALPGAEREPVILLAHEPDFADFASRHQVSFVLAGHTHGGQIRIPLLPPLHLPEMGTRYVEGLFTLDNRMQLYVNRGIGAVGVPFRLRCPPEITVITLQPVS
jgi:predicted MPP superfamily phosphohydrolase